MNQENLSKKYQQLLEENQLLRNRIASLEATLKNAGVSLVEDGATKDIESKPAIIPTQALGKSYLDSAQSPTPSLNKFSSPAEKISLYMSLFKGREDVYAHKYFNKKQGKMVYGPMKSKPWERKPGDGEYAPFESELSITICVGLMG